MARYYFDIRRDKSCRSDRVGYECEDLVAVKSRARRLLGLVSAREPFDEDGMHLVVHVRDRADRHVFMATLLIVGNRLG